MAHIAATMQDTCGLPGGFAHLVYDGACVVDIWKGLVVYLCVYSIVNKLVQEIGRVVARLGAIFYKGEHRKGIDNGNLWTFDGISCNSTSCSTEILPGNWLLV